MATRRTIITPGLAAVQVGERATGTPCRYRKGLRPVIYNGRMAICRGRAS
jgi:hypothetical protein